VKIKVSRNARHLNNVPARRRQAGGDFSPFLANTAGILARFAPRSPQMAPTPKAFNMKAQGNALWFGTRANNAAL